MWYNTVICGLFFIIWAINCTYLHEFDKHYTHEKCGLNTTVITYYGDECLGAKFRSTILKTGQSINLKYPTYASFFDCVTLETIKEWEKDYLMQKRQHDCYINKKIGFGYVRNIESRYIYDRYIYGCVLSTIAIASVTIINLII